MMQTIKPARVQFARLAVTALGAFALALSGCSAKSDAPTSAPASQPALERQTPAEAVQTLFNLLHAERAARVAGDKAAAKRIVGQLVELCAREVVLSRYQAKLHGDVEDPDGVMRTYVRGWAAMLGFYLDSVHLDRAVIVGADQDSQVARVRVPADSPRGTEEIEISCLRARDGTWHIDRLYFARPTSATQPTSAPGG